MPEQKPWEQYAAAPAAGPWEQYAQPAAKPPLSDEITQILARQKTQYPSDQEKAMGAVAPQPPLPARPQDDPRSGGELGQDLGADFVRGIPQAITSIPSMLGALGKSALEIAGTPSRIATKQGAGAFPETRSMVQGAVAPLATMGRNAGALADSYGLMGNMTVPLGLGNMQMNLTPPTPPTPKEDSQAAQFGGASVGNVMLGAGLGAISKPMAGPLRGSAVRSMEEAFQPKGVTNKIVMQRIAPELVDRGVIAGTQQGLADKMMANKEAAGQNLEAGWAKEPNKPIYVKPIIDAIEKSKWDNNAMALDIHGSPVVQGPELVAAADKVKDIVEQYGPFAPSQSLVSLRRLWDTAVKKTNGFTTADVSDLNTFKREGSSKIREVLSQEHPNMDELNAEYGLWKGASDIIGDTVLRNVGQGAPLGHQVGQAAGAAIGLATKGPIAAIENAAALKMFNKLTSSVGWKTVSAAAKNELAKAIMSGNQTLTSLTVAKIAAENAGKGQQ